MGLSGLFQHSGIISSSINMWCSTLYVICCTSTQQMRLKVLDWINLSELSHSGKEGTVSPQVVLTLSGPGYKDTRAWQEATGTLRSASDLFQIASDPTALVQG